MQLDTVSSFEALFALLALIAFAALVFRIVPVGTAPVPAHRFSEAEIRAHDGALPKYLLVSFAALTVGGVHLAVRSIPPVADWLMRGGYGGHLAREIAYSHMTIVMGGTVALTGLSWYVLPRILRRPLYSETLAEIAFWATVAGALGFYLANLIGGASMAALLNAGRTEAQIDDSVGLWRNLATGLSATVMGIGYWTYVINVFVTILGARRADGPRPHRHLAKFFFVGAAALFVGTVQGVLQVVPENVEWLHAAGAAGRLIDPISHAHVNLITGVLSILAGVVFYVTRSGDDAQRMRDRRVETVVFWALVPASAAFYIVFLYLGFAEGHLIVGQGLSASAAEARLGWQHDVLIATTGTLTFLAIWLFLWVTLRRLIRARPAGSVMIGFGLGLLALGTLHGVAQTMPVIHDWMEAAGPAEDSIAGAHAQINIIGGVLLMLLGSGLSVGAPMLPDALPRGLLRRTGLAMGAGALAYYASALAAALIAGSQIAGNDASAIEALSRATNATAVGTVGGALLYTVGAAVALQAIWRSTGDVRRAGWDQFKRAIARNNTSSESWRQQVPYWTFVLPEFLSAMFGFPGVGWLLSGRAMIGGPLILAGQATAWAILPILLSPFGEHSLPQLTPTLLESYLVATAVLSATALWFVAVRNRQAVKQGGRASSPG
ncbi:hypothetical protein HKCCE3408_11210 [Rhodobacterales bacterium HKCCE3408]|nr:hypothetical protein [Rhodobacterales bacterium HKCCE3408]